jgi:hypothetical protein
VLVASRRPGAVALVALVVWFGAAAPRAIAQEPVVTELRVSGQPGRPLEPNLVGFNWRAGGEAVAPLRPGLVRTFAVRLARISPSPGVLDFAAADAELDAISATGATPIVVLIQRPPWDPAAGSAGYEAVVEAVVRHYLVDRPAAGHPPVWFESGNEPEFPPTSHGQLPHELAADVAAQVRAIARVEADTGVVATYGGPGALFADPPVVAAFVAAARGAGRLPDFVSWHTYTNAPMLGPDGPEDRSNPAAVAAWEALHGTNPAASPSILGIGIDVMRAAVTGALLPGEQPPALLITEWNLSPGGFDDRNDTFVGAAHTVASLIEMHTRGLDGSTFFAAVDRHCSDPDVNPGGASFCGDWGTASAAGARKPVWHAFELWRTLAGSTRTVSGADPDDGLWAVATDDGGTTRVLVASFSVADPTARRLRLVVEPVDGRRTVVVRRIDGTDATGAPVASVLAERADAVHVDLAANSVVLVEIGAPVATAAPDADPGLRSPGTGALPATGGPSPLGGALAVAAAFVAHLARRASVSARPRRP